MHDCTGERGTTNVAYDAMFWESVTGLLQNLELIVKPAFLKHFIEIRAFCAWWHFTDDPPSVVGPLPAIADMREGDNEIEVLTWS